MKLFFYCCFIICLAYGLAISSFEAVAQISEKGIPESFQLNQKSATIIPVLKLDSVHVQRMIEDDKKFRIDNRYGVVHPCDINIKDAGVKTEIQGKGTIWQYKIESKDAYSLGVFFKTYHLPPQAKVFIYDSSRARLRGAFTQKNNTSGQQLPIAEFPEKNLIIEYFEPVSPEFSGELVLGSISQAYADFKHLASDRIGVNCSLGNNWQVQKNCVCLMTFHDAAFSYFCSGALLNNVKEDLTPFFLTANHCIRTESVANSLVTYFSYENSTCTAADASNNQSLSGATFKSGSTYSDFSLLLLNEYPPDEYNPYFAGWDATGNTPLSGVCIHHPDGEPKCIAIDTIPLTSYPEKVQWTYDGLRLSSTTLPNTHWQVQFTQGSPELGSSGAPLFDPNKRIVGQLHGGANFVLLYGRFSLSWDYNPSHLEQLAHWLDPDSICTTRILNGIWRIPPTAKFRAELRDVCPNTPVSFYDESTQKPIGWIWRIKPSTYSFANGTDSISQNPQVKFMEKGYYTVTLYSTNKYGSDMLTQKNYIFAESKLEVKLLKSNSDNVICGCDLKSFPVAAVGAVAYDFNLDKNELISTKSVSNKLYLTLNPEANITNSFDTWVKVNGTNGLCYASDSMLLHVVIQPNDNIANAARLYPGRNSGYSNKCATVEKYEPNPTSTDCAIKNSWCPDFSSYSVLNNSIWFTFTSPSSGWLTINTSGFDDQIALYKYSSPGPIMLSSKSQFSLVAANDNRSVTDNTAIIENLLLEPGRQYWLQVDGNNAAYGDIVIDLISNSLEVFPNPSIGIFKLIISNPVNGVADVFISDLNGRKVFANKFNIDINSNKLDFNLSGFAKGIYLLNVRLNGSNLCKKLVLF